MKTTVKIDAGKALVVEPNKTGPGLRVSLELFGATLATAVLDTDQASALMFGFECALDADLVRRGCEKTKRISVTHQAGPGHAPGR